MLNFLVTVFIKLIRIRNRANSNDDDAPAFRFPLTFSWESIKSARMSTICKQTLNWHLWFP